MEIKVTVVHELGASVAAVLTAIAAQAAGVETSGQKVSTAKIEKAAAPDQTEEDKPARGRRNAAKEGKVAEEPKAPLGDSDKATGASRRRSAGAKKEEAPKEVPFIDRSEDEQLKEIMRVVGLVSKKKGGGDDVREMLSVYDAGKSSNLLPEDYVEFYAGLERYRAGESVDEIYPEVD